MKNDDFEQILAEVAQRVISLPKGDRLLAALRQNQIFLDLSGFQRFWASRSKSQAGIGVEAFLDLFFV